MPSTDSITLMYTGDVILFLSFINLSGKKLCLLFTFFACLLSLLHLFPLDINIFPLSWTINFAVIT